MFWGWGDWVNVWWEYQQIWVFKSVSFWSHFKGFGAYMHCEGFKEMLWVKGLQFEFVMLLILLEYGGWIMEFTTINLSGLKINDIFVICVTLTSLA